MQQAGMTTNLPNNWRLGVVCFVLTSLIFGLYNWSDHVLTSMFNGFAYNKTEEYLKLTTPDVLLQYCVVDINSSESTQKCGKPFSRTWLPYLEMFNYSDGQTSQMTSADDEKILRSTPQFVTAFSDNHFDDGFYRMIRTLHETLPGHKVIVYDLGLNADHLDKLRASPLVLAVRRFNFEAYPSYVANLFEYRWKPLLIAEMLREYPSVFYADAHVVFKENDLNGLLDRIRCQKSEADNCLDVSVMMGYVQHSIYSTTDKRTYDYFPIDINRTKQLDMGAATLQLIYGTKELRQSVQKWLVLCALESNCMAPQETTRFCQFTNDRFNDYAHCHRYDQSVVSILLAIRNKFDVSKYIVPWNYTR